MFHALYYVHLDFSGKEHVVKYQAYHTADYVLPYNGSKQRHVEHSLLAGLVAPQELKNKAILNSLILKSVYVQNEKK